MQKSLMSAYNSISFFVYQLETLAAVHAAFYSARRIFWICFLPLFTVGALNSKEHAFSKSTALFLFFPHYLFNVACRSSVMKNHGLPLRAAENLLKRSGATRTSLDAKQALHDALLGYGTKLAQHAIENAQREGRATVCAEDVAYARKVTRSLND